MFRRTKPPAQRRPLVPGKAADRTVAALIGVKPRTVAGWRAGNRKPQPHNDMRLGLVRKLARQVTA